MTLAELYEKIGGDYKQACNVMRVDKLIDKHIRKFKNNELVADLLEAEKNNDATAIFEITHALKGVCANLGLKKIADLASEITEDFRPGKDRELSDEQVKEKINEIKILHEQCAAEITNYENQQ